MVTTPTQIEFVQEVPTATVGDTVPNAAAGNLILFSEGGIWYSKSSTGAVTALSGLTALTSTDKSLQALTSGTAVTLSSGQVAASVPTTASKVYAQADRGTAFLRSNSGAAMTDTLPVLNDTTDLGYTISVYNLGTTVAETITYSAGTKTFQSSGTSSYTQQYGTRQTFIWGGTAIGWIFGAGNANLLRTGGSVTAGNVPKFSDTSGRVVQDSGASLASGSVVSGTNTGDQSTVTDSTINNSGTSAAPVLGRAAITGDVAIAAGSNVSAIAAGVVTTAKMANVPAHSYLGNNSGASAAAAYITSTQLTADLNLATAALQGLLQPSHFKFISAIDGAQFINVQANAYSTPLCDGATDDTAAMTALLANAPDGSTICFPGQNSTMVISGALSIPAGKHFNFVCADDGKFNILQTSPTADHFTLNDWYSTFTGISFLTINTTTTTAGQALTSGTVLAVGAIPSLAYVAAAGTITVGSSAGWQTLTYSARTSTTVTLSQNGTGTTVAGAPLVFKTAGDNINAGNYVGIDAIDCSSTCAYNGYVAAGAVANASIIRNWGGLNCINNDIWIDGANWNGIITDCTADCTTSSRTACHLLLTQCGAVTGSNNQWIRGQYDMILGSTTAAYPAGVFSVYFTNCFYDNAGTDAVKIQGISAVQRVKLTDSWLSSAQGGSGLNLASTAATLPSDINLSNCNIYSNAVNGVGGNGAQDVTLTNCQVAGNGTAGVNSFVARLRVTGSRIGPVGGIGANGTGIILPAGAYTSVQITDNDLSGNTTAPLTDNSTSIATKQINWNVGLAMAPTPNPAAQVLAATTTYVTPGLQVPANALRVGTTMRFKVIVSTTASATTYTVLGKAGTAGTTADGTTVTMATTGTATSAGQAEIEVTMVVRSVGAAGVIVASAKFAATGTGYSGAVLSGAAVLATATVNTTVANFFGVAITASAASTGTVQAAIAEVVQQ